MSFPVKNIRDFLFGASDPYAGTDLRYVDHGYRNTHLAPPVIETVLRLVRPTFWLEIGSFIGGSAIRTARTIKRLGLPTQMVCMDPFCGSAPMWRSEAGLKSKGEWSALQLENGRPTILERFRANVTKAGVQDIILPFPVTSTVGIHLLLNPPAGMQTRPEVIYLDSSHQPDETFFEVRECWRLLTAGGVLFGDDWGFKSVHNDVARFARSVKQNEAHLEVLRGAMPAAAVDDGVLVDGGQWFMPKP